MSYIPMSEIRQASRGHFFDRTTMRFFSCVLPRGGYKSRDGRRAYFVSSEQFKQNFPRLYTVRMIDLMTGETSTHGEFQDYRTPDEAKSAAKAALAEYDAGTGQGV